MTWLRASLKVFLILITLFIGLGLTVTIIPLSGFRRGLGSYRVRNCCTRAWSSTICSILGMRIETLGTPSTESTLTVANHISWLDIMALASQRDYVFVAKQEVGDWPLLGKIFEGVGTLFIRRGNREDSDHLSGKMAEYLTRKIPLMLFPEATTTDGTRVRRFSGKLMAPARQTDQSIQPVAIRYGSPESAVTPFIGDDAFVTHLLKVARLPEIRISLNFLPPIPAGSLPADEIPRFVQSRIATALFD